MRLLNGVSTCSCESRAAEPLPHSCAGAAVPLGDSSAPAAIAAGRLSQAGHVSGGVGCGCLAAFQPQHGGPLRSFVRLRCVLSFRPFADCFQRGVIFCACGTAGCRLVWGCKLWIAPTPALFFCTFRVARLYRRFPLWRVQTFAPPHSPSMLPGQSVPSYRSPGAAPAPRGSQSQASSPTGLHQGGECRCGRSWRPQFAQHIA